MSDEALREAERAFAADKSAGNEARLLVERVRAGKLSEERLRLLAYVGYPAAVLVRGGEVKAPVDEEAWLEGLVAFGQEVCVRVMLAVLPFGAAGRGRMKWFVGDIFFLGEPGEEYVNMTLPVTDAHRARIFRLGERPVGGFESIGSSLGTACRPGIGIYCRCFEFSFAAKDAALLFAKKLWSMFSLASELDVNEERFAELRCFLVADIRRDLTFWAFASE